MVGHPAWGNPRESEATGFRRVLAPAIVALSAAAARRAPACGFRRTAVPAPAPEGPTILLTESGEFLLTEDGDTLMTEG
jgi:hypothetical protein